MTGLPLHAEYVVPPGHFDEARASDGTLRPPWAEFAASTDVTTEYLAQAHKRVIRQIDENGITYNVHATADGIQRPWSLDVVPLIVKAPEWEPLERGLRQRARLLNAVATDIYGPQTLLRSGLLPPALVFRHPGFLRACHGVRPPGGVFLHLVAFDLARATDGSWRVVGTRTQAPSGLGYALENRAIISRMLPDAFHALRIHALSPFLQQLRRIVSASAPSNTGAPHIVVLTPGPFAETYFEHAFLARQLGFPLVEGGDLTVRDSCVYLKTVSGLRAVHAILRRLDDDYCDPLELRADSKLGVPGLLQAWRAGNVTVVNAFGMGVIESPALLAFLPRICQRLFDETLETPAIATWWCGETAALADARRRLAEGVIKPAFADSAMEPVFVSDLDADARREWAERLGTTPDAYVVEEFLPLSHAPVWHDAHLESRALMLRVFLVADGRGDYRLMPGGLSRIAGEERHVVSGQRGGSSKDTWVLSDVALAAAAPVEPPAQTRGVDDDDQTSSRAAEHLFWLGRYAERSENAARLLRSVLGRMTDTGGVQAGLHPAFVRACGRHGLLDKPAPDSAAPAIVAALIAGLTDSHGHRSLGFNVEQTVRVASAVRDRLSTDNWRVLNRLLQLFTRDSRALDLDDALGLIDEALLSLVAIGGLEMAHMTRDDGWRFLSLGRHLERLHFVSSTLSDVAKEQAAAGSGLLEWLLELSDSLLTYRVRHMRQPEWESVVDLTIVDERNPRSARFQLTKLAKHVRLLPDAGLVEVLAEVEGLLRDCRADADSNQGELFGGGTRQLETLLARCQRFAIRLGDALALSYFSHVHDVPRATIGV
ncbi:MAG: circularly permuted type 2 ATP-grasp protein [Vicinamibacterales bacterium]